MTPRKSAMSAPDLGELPLPQILPESEKLQAVRDRIESRYKDSEVPEQLFIDVQFLSGLVEGLQDALERRQR